MPHSFVFNDNDFGCTITSSDGLYEMVLGTWNPTTQKDWNNQDEVIEYVNSYPTTSHMWTLISSKPTQEEIDEKSSIFNRDRRNQLLTESDWTQGNDSPLTDETKTSWATYRTALRNLPTHKNWPSLEDDDWPTQPE
tara:strand:- start:184 stop:594 length:411 start_codon:yes stop_codon:yes gene_type:complete